MKKYDGFITDTINQLKLIKDAFECCLSVEAKEKPNDNKYIKAGIDVLVKEIKDFLSEDYGNQEPDVVFNKIDMLLKQIKSCKDQFYEVIPVEIVNNGIKKN